MSTDAHTREILNRTPTDRMAVYCSCGWQHSVSYYDKTVQQAGDECVAAHNAHRNAMESNKDQGEEPVEGLGRFGGNMSLEIYDNLLDALVGPMQEAFFEQARLIRQQPDLPRDYEIATASGYEMWLSGTFDFRPIIDALLKVINDWMTEMTFSVAELETKLNEITESAGMTLSDAAAVRQFLSELRQSP